MSTKRQLNLCIGFNTTGYLTYAWPYRTGTKTDIFDLAYYQQLAHLAHRGRFDAVFLSDNPALSVEPKGRPFHTLDPLTLSTAILAQVPDIGAIATVSTTYNLPYNLARSTQSADLLSGGRLGLNVVSTFNPLSAANYSADPLPPREERYARATEFIEVCKGLWNSWDPRRAEVPDDLYWNPETAKSINYKGAYQVVRGPLNVPRGPQGYPVLAQAGGSDSGIELAARHAELVYCSMLTREAAREFGRKIRDKAADIGRDPASIRILPGVVPIIADSRDEALRKHELWSGTGSEDGLLKRFVAENGLDADTFDPDAVLTPEDFVPKQSRGASVGMQMGLTDLIKYERVTARQAVRRTEYHHRLLLGTAEDIADGLIDFWQDGSVDGWVVQPPRAPDDIQLFVNKVVPILQERGVFRRGYAGDTLRQRFGLPLPA
ncbi:NtaA/DmoA family FMN-dependent monooxygenase [Devosia sp. CN2-171]|uniref:NtaA/DmoA family FMN-dependent monooxygenase n=1 Tax=Devosia sp. CN2-171 TaxID=3400909 RepID=UPI003BF83FCA